MLGIYQEKCHLAKKGRDVRTHKNGCATYMTNLIRVSASLWRLLKHEYNFNTLYSMKDKCRLLKKWVGIGPMTSLSYVLVKNVWLTRCAAGVAAPNSNIHAITGIGRWTDPINRLLASQQTLTNCWNKYIVLLIVQIVETGYHGLFVIVVLVGRSKSAEFHFYGNRSHRLRTWAEIFVKVNSILQLGCLEYHMHINTWNYISQELWIQEDGLEWLLFYILNSFTKVVTTSFLTP
jgi:hypothetical protein